MKNVAVFGSTGSIGTSALKVARDKKDLINVIALVGNSNIDLLADQVLEFNVKCVGIFDESRVEEFKNVLLKKSNNLVDRLVPLNLEDIKIFSGKSGLVEIVDEISKKSSKKSMCDILLMSIVGTEGLIPCIHAIKKGIDIALASKEIMVIAGRIVMSEAELNNVNIIPVDSEHNAIFQCLQSDRNKNNLSKIILTASGGPFREKNASEFINITPKQALAHPTWEMGKKISIDSATLFNKGLEMIEAKFLFGIDMNMIDVVVHPQSIVHSLVEFIDGSCIAQMSNTDMCFPIQYALTYPDRFESNLASLNLSRIRTLEFYSPREDDFPALRLARYVGEKEGCLPAVYNSSNEIAVEAFLENKIKFPDIWEIVECVINDFEHSVKPSFQPILDDILNADLWARNRATELLSNF